MIIEFRQKIANNHGPLHQPSSMRSNVAREDTNTNRHDDTSMNNILNDSYDETRKRDSPESVNSMYNQRVRNFEREIDRK